MGHISEVLEEYHFFMGIGVGEVGEGKVLDTFWCMAGSEFESAGAMIYDRRTTDQAAVNGA